VRPISQTITVGLLSAVILTLLRWALLGLIYLFFARVLQAAWATAAPRAQAATPVVSTKRRGRRSTKASLVVLEPLELAGSEFALDTEITLGRAASCNVTLDDTYVSQLHARLENGASGVVLTDLGSTNGTYLNRQKVTSPVPVQLGDRIQMGSTVMEMRL